MPNHTYRVSIPEGEAFPHAEYRDEMTRVTCEAFSVPGEPRLDPSDPDTSAVYPGHLSEHSLRRDSTVSEYFQPGPGGDLLTVVYGLAIPVRQGLDAQGRVDDHRLPDMAVAILEAQHSFIEERGLSWIERARVRIAAGNQPALEIERADPEVGEPENPEAYITRPHGLSPPEGLIVVDGFCGGYFGGEETAPHINKAFVRAGGLVAVRNSIKVVASRIPATRNLPVVTRFHFAGASEEARKLGNNGVTLSVLLNLPDSVEDGDARQDFASEVAGETGGVLGEQINGATMYVCAQAGNEYADQHWATRSDLRGRGYRPS